MNTPLSTRFSHRIRELIKGFVGRQWLFKEVDRFLEQREKRYLIITGEPGIGKSAIAAKLIEHYGISAYHFCIAREATTLTPRGFVENLALTLSIRIPAYADLLENLGDQQINITVNQEIIKGDGTGVLIQNLNIGNLSGLQAFERLVLHPLQVLAQENRLSSLVLLVDALDEASSIRDENIVDVLGYAQDLPEPVHVILTSRDESHVRRHFRDYLLLKAENPENRADVCLYIRNRVVQSKAIQERLADAQLGRKELVERFAEASKGNFLYIRLLMDNIASGRQSLADLSGFPDGLEEIYREFLATRIGKDKKGWEQLRPLLGVLAVAKEPLTLGQLTCFTEFSPQMLRDALLDLIQFLDPGLSQQKRYEFWHQSLIDFLLDENWAEDYWIDAREWHARIANAYLNAFCGNWDACDHYGLNYLLAHLQVAHLWNEMTNLLTDLDFIGSKIKRVSVHALLEDMYITHTLLTRNKKAEKASKIAKALLKYLLGFGSIYNEEFNIEHIHASLFYVPETDFAEEFLELGLNQDLIRECIDESIDISLILIAFHEKLAEMKRRKGDFKEAELQLNQLLEQLKTHPHENSNTTLARVEYNLGYVKFLCGEFGEAVEILCQSATDAMRGGNVVGASISRCVEYRVRMLKELWQIEESKKIPVQAVKEFEITLNEALPHFQNESKTNPHAERWVMNVRAHLFEISFLKKDTSSAENYLTALRKDEWVKRHGGMEFLKPYLARFSILKEDWTKAVEYFKEYFNDIKSATGKDEIRKRESITRDYYDYGYALKGLGKTEEAVNIWQESLSYPDGFGNHIWKKKIENELLLLFNG